MTHSNISIFVPHLGCPNCCSFCDQRSITGKISEPTANDIKAAVEIATLSKGFVAENTEIAFFGGSFTAIDRQYMLELLKCARELVNHYGIHGIRISTRPDAITEEILEILKVNKVTAIELGAQSMDDRVLELNDRGHKSGDVVKASRLIKEYGFELGLQMMTGLYGDTDIGAKKTAEIIISLRPDTVRIYPTIVFENTRLAKLYESGVYKPQELKSAVSLCADLVVMFNKAKIDIIRTGLHTIDESAFVAGPWHPAFSEFCMSELIYRHIIAKCKKEQKYEIYVCPSDISKAVGQRKSNLSRLLSEGYNIRFIQDKSIIKDTIKIKEVN